MIYGKLGVTPLQVDIKCRIIRYWSSLICSIPEDTDNINTTKLASKVYYVLQELQYRNIVRSAWIENVRECLCTSGFSGIWYSQSFTSRKWLVASFTQRQKDLYIQSWMSDINALTDTNIYKHLKQGKVIILVFFQIIFV